MGVVVGWIWGKDAGMAGNKKNAARSGFNLTSDVNPLGLQ